MHPTFPVKLIKLRDPVGLTTHALLKCPRCLKGLGVTKSMLAGIDSIICKGALGNTSFICNGHYYYRAKERVLEFVGTVQ